MLIKSVQHSLSILKEICCYLQSLTYSVLIMAIGLPKYINILIPMVIAS